MGKSGKRIYNLTADEGFTLKILYEVLVGVRSHFMIEEGIADFCVAALRRFTTVAYSFECEVLSIYTYYSLIFIAMAMLWL